MKLNNKGFAISTFMYMILVIALILILATLSILSGRRMILDKQKNIAIENISALNPICEAVDGLKSLELGTKYRCEVKENNFFNFYVLSIQGNKVNLIMDRNICEDGTTNYVNDPNNNYCRYAWHAGEGRNKYGPDTAMKRLYNATKKWINVPDMIMNYTDEKNTNSNIAGYTSIVTSNGVTTITGKSGAPNTTIGTSSAPLKTRLPKLSEVEWCITQTNSSNCSEWLYVGSDGYWLLSSSNYAGGEPFAYSVGIIESRVYMNNSAVVNENSHGIRPVIMLPKSMLK